MSFNSFRCDHNQRKSETGFITILFSDAALPFNKIDLGAGISLLKTQVGMGRSATCHVETREVTPHDAPATRAHGR